MKRTLSLVIPVFFVFLVNTCRADDPVLINSSDVIPGLNPYSVQSSLSLELNSGMENDNSKESQSLNKHGIITGTILIVCGAALGYTGHKLGKEYYARYKKSAFTENTDPLRREVVGCNVLRIGGAAVAGTGVLVFVFSF